MKTIKSKKSPAPKSAAAPARPAVVAKTAAKKAAKIIAAPKPTAKATAKPVTTKATAAPAAASRQVITNQTIASRAYSLWEQRGRPQGQDQELWLLAEQQLKESQSFAA